MKKEQLKDPHQLVKKKQLIQKSIQMAMTKEIKVAEW